MSELRRKIMIVDDNVANLTMGRNLLKSNYEVYLASSAKQMFEMLKKIRPDLILLDIEMPGMDGYEAITKLKASADYAGVPVMFLTAQNTEQSELKGFDLGAVDYVNKPFSPPLLLKRIEHQLLIVKQREVIQSHTDNLSVMVSEKVGEVFNLQNAILGTVADLVEFRDQFTGGHIARTQMYLKAIIDGLIKNNLYTDSISGWNMDFVLQSAQLHDVGKIAIPDAILNKPARLTQDEFDIMKTHVTVGLNAVNRIIKKTKEQAFLRYALNLVGAHHEKWDGTGYPYGVKGADIPLEGRLMAVADVYDALVSWRPYKEKMPHGQAAQIIREGRGKHFDPVLVDVFLDTEGIFERISSDGAPYTGVIGNAYQDAAGDEAGKAAGGGVWNGPGNGNADENGSVGAGGNWFAAVIFTEDMETGNGQIDAQHRELIERLDTLVSMKASDASNGDIQEMLDFLGDYVVRHFADEENLQKQSGYPKYEWHKSQHLLFINEYKKLKAEFVVSGFSPGFSQKLRNSIVDWIVRHIKTVDVEFGKYYQFRMPPDETGEMCGA